MLTENRIWWMILLLFFEINLPWLSVISIFIFLWKFYWNVCSVKYSLSNTNLPYPRNTFGSSETIGAPNQYISGGGVYIAFHHVLTALSYLLFNIYFNSKLSWYFFYSQIDSAVLLISFTMYDLIYISSSHQNIERVHYTPQCYWSILLPTISF